MYPICTLHLTLGYIGELSTTTKRIYRSVILSEKLLDLKAEASGIKVILIH